MKTITVENNQVFITNTITNEKVKHNYSMNNRPLSVVELYTSIDPIDIRKSREKKEITALWRAAGDELGTSVANFSRMLNGACYKAYIKDNEDLHNRFGVEYKKVGGKVKRVRTGLAVEMVNTYCEVIRQYIADGNTHLAGFSIPFGEASVAKKKLGKGLWKQLNKNSKTKNDLICKILNAYSEPKLDTTAYTAMLNNTPSTILSMVDSANTLLAFFNTESSTGMKDTVKKSIQHIGLPMYKLDYERLQRVIVLIRDTHRMHQNFNPNWSLTRIKEEHQITINEQFALRHSKERFSWLNLITQYFEANGNKAELMCSAYDIAILGKDQGHYVGNYARFSKDANYVVYRITDCEGTISTLGIRHPDETNHLCDQHYLRFNYIVANEACLSFAAKITRQVKKELELIDISKKQEPLKPITQAIDFPQIEADDPEDTPF